MIGVFSSFGLLLFFNSAPNYVPTFSKSIFRVLEIKKMLLVRTWCAVLN